HKEQERICRQLGNINGLAISLGNQAVILKARGDLNGAMALLTEQERICRQLGNINGLAISLADQANLLGRRSPQAVELASEAYRLAAEHGLSALARQIEPILRSLLGGQETIGHTQVRDSLSSQVDIPGPHPGAN